MPIYDGIFEIMDQGSQKYLYIRKLIVSRSTSTDVDP